MNKLCKNSTKILLEDALAMTFIDFGLLRNPYCMISYLLLTYLLTQQVSKK